MSGSASILSSLMDSILDSIVSVTALGSIIYARRPADEEHRWGHGKMEAVSALFQSAIMAGGAAFLIFESLRRLAAPVAVTAHVLGIAVMVLSIVLSAVLVLIQRRAIRQTGSLAVEADSVHYGSDILINLGVLAVLALGYYGAPLWIDPLFAIVVAGFLVRVAQGIAAKAMDMLLDRELPEEDRSRIINIIAAHKGVLGVHDLRTYRNGTNVVITFDIEVTGTLSLTEAHGIARGAEKDLLAVYPNAEILIHVDPCGDRDDLRHRVKGVHR